MTAGRAALVGLINRYLRGLLDPFVTRLQVHKLMHFMQEYLTAPDATKTFVYVSTIQRMTINLFGWEKAFKQDGNDLRCQ